jgi:hypothetical protein
MQILDGGYRGYQGVCVFLKLGGTAKILNIVVNDDYPIVALITLREVPNHHTRKIQSYAPSEQMRLKISYGHAK